MLLEEKGWIWPRMYLCRQRLTGLQVLWLGTGDSMAVCTELSVSHRSTW